MPGRVVVVGAGPGGAMLAWLLAARGVPVTLVERHDDFGREFRGERLMPSAVALLRQIGLGDHLDALPQLRIAGTDVYVDGRRRYRMPFGSPDQSPLFVPQSALLEIIVADAAARFPNAFTLRRGVTVRDVVRDQHARVVGVVVDAPDGAEVLDASLVIGADGRSSLMARRAGLTEGEVGEAETFDVIWTSLPAPPDLSDRARLYIRNPGRFATAIPAPGGRLQLGYFLEKGGYADIRRAGRQAWIELVRVLIDEPLAAHLALHRNDLAPTFLDVQCHRLARWSVPGLLLIGDAAHPMSPAGGQGIALALRDAAVAVETLTPVLLNGQHSTFADIDGACQRFQHRRQVEVADVQDIQRRTAKMYFQRTPGARFAARVVAPVASRVAPRMLSRSVGAKRAMTHGIDDVSIPNAYTNVRPTPQPRPSQRSTDHDHHPDPEQLDHRRRLGQTEPRRRSSANRTRPLARITDRGRSG